MECKVYEENLVDAVLTHKGGWQLSLLWISTCTLLQQQKQNYSKCFWSKILEFKLNYNRLLLLITVSTLALEENECVFDSVISIVSAFYFISSWPNTLLGKWSVWLSISCLRSQPHLGIPCENTYLIQQLCYLFVIVSQCSIIRTGFIRKKKNKNKQ